MQIFHDPDSLDGTTAFNSWRLADAKRFVLTLPAATDARLHKGQCSTFVFHGNENLTIDQKLCSQDYRELKQWASDNGRTLKRCLRCKPPI